LFYFRRTREDPINARRRRLQERRDRTQKDEPINPDFQFDELPKEENKEESN